MYRNLSDLTCSQSEAIEYFPCIISHMPGIYAISNSSRIYFLFFSLVYIYIVCLKKYRSKFLDIIIHFFRI